MSTVRGEPHTAGAESPYFHDTLAQLTSPTLRRPTRPPRRDRISPRSIGEREQQRGTGCAEHWLC
jgi:hypothetical protein